MKIYPKYLPLTLPCVKLNWPRESKIKEESRTGILAYFTSVKFSLKIHPLKTSLPTINFACGKSHQYKICPLYLTKRKKVRFCCCFFFVAFFSFSSFLFFFSTEDDMAEVLIEIFACFSYLLLADKILVFHLFDFSLFSFIISFLCFHTSNIVSMLSERT